MPPAQNHRIVELIADNLADLPHRDGHIKYTQFDHRFTTRPATIIANRYKFAEAIVDLLETHGYRVARKRANTDDQ